MHCMLRQLLWNELRLIKHNMKSRQTSSRNIQVHPRKNCAFLVRACAGLMTCTVLSTILHNAVPVHSPWAAAWELACAASALGPEELCTGPFEDSLPTGQAQAGAYWRPQQSSHLGGGGCLYGVCSLLFF